MADYPVSVTYNPTDNTWTLGGLTWDPGENMWKLEVSGTTGTKTIEFEFPANVDTQYKFAGIKVNADHSKIDSTTPKSSGSFAGTPITGISRSTDMKTLTLTDDVSIAADRDKNYYFSIGISTDGGTTGAIWDDPKIYNRGGQRGD